jgi:hypothetical protein
VRGRAAVEERRKRRTGRKAHFLHHGGRDDAHVDAFRARHQQRCEAGDIDVERAGAQRLDHIGAGLEGRHRERDTGLFGPALAVGDEDLRHTHYRNVSDPQWLLRERARCGCQQAGGESSGENAHATPQKERAGRPNLGTGAVSSSERFSIFRHSRARIFPHEVGRQ